MDKTISIPEPNTIAQSFAWKVKKLLLIGVNNGNEDPPPNNISNEIWDNIAANEITPKK